MTVGTWSLTRLNVASVSVSVSVSASTETIVFSVQEDIRESKTPGAVQGTYPLVGFSFLHVLNDFFWPLDAPLDVPMPVERVVRTPCRELNICATPSAGHIYRAVYFYERVFPQLLFSRRRAWCCQAHSHGGGSRKIGQICFEEAGFAIYTMGHVQCSGIYV